MEKYWKIDCFSGWIRTDWGNTAWADMAGSGSKGLNVEGLVMSITISARLCLQCLYMYILGTDQNSCTMVR